jgi:O-succinylbenzoic acid--CoA ligase
MSRDIGSGPSIPLLPSAARVNALERAGSPAIIDGTLSWTWRELDSRADAVASGLADAGITRGSRVALLAQTRAAAIAFLYGAERAGAAVVPLNARLAAAELSGFLADTGVTAIVASQEMSTRAGLLARQVLSLEALAEWPAAAMPQPGLAVPGDPAVIVATSGTTGRPKAALLTHGQMAASAAAWNDFLPQATGWLTSLSLAHVGGLGIVWRAALSGVPAVVPPTGDAASLLRAASQPRVSHVSVVGVQLARLLDEAGGGPAPSNLRAVLLGGGPIGPGLVSRALTLGWPMVPTYGMTESASGVTALATAEAVTRPASSGRPLPGVELRIAHPSSDGIGEIEVRGPSLFSGYVGRPAETAASFDADGWYRTGDLGSVDTDGYLAVADRRLDLIISGGENVYPAEVEAVLTSHPAIADAGVAGRPDRTWGAVPVAVVTIRSGMAVTDEEILVYCRSRLAGFKAPVAIVRVPEVPRLGTGKLDRRAVRQLLSIGETGAPGGVRPQPTPPVRYLNRPDGVRVAYRVLGAPPVGFEDGARRPVVLLLHSTLSSGWQLKGLARLLAAWATVILPDRRGSGGSRLPDPGPVDLDDQLADVIALLDEVGADRVTVLGHSYGAIVALALARSQPERVEAVVAYEPSLLTVLPPGELGTLAGVARAVVSAHAAGGASAAAEVFLRAIGAVEALSAASPSTRAALLREGDGVLADVGAIGSATVDLAGVVCPVALVTGDASASFYASIADAASRSMPRAERLRLPGLGHEAPITQPAALAKLVRRAATGSRVP